MLNMQNPHLSTVLTFLRGFSQQPADVGTCLPSGPHLARQMAELVDKTLPGPVIELGPGTGPVTRALLDCGIDAGRLLLIEYGREFIPYLHTNFPELNIVYDNAFRLARIMQRRKLAPAAAIVSGLPMLNFPAEQCRNLLRDACHLLTPGGSFIQVTYGQSPPVEPPEGMSVTLGQRVWLNAPPATLWVYRAENTTD